MHTKPLTKYQTQSIQGRWLYLFLALLMSFNAIDQYRRHDSFCWLAAASALIFAAHSVRAWVWKRRQGREAQGPFN